MATTTKINGTSSANNFGFYANVVVGDLDNTTQKFPVTVNLYLVNNGTRTNSSNWTKSITCDGTTKSSTSQTINTTGVSVSGGVTQVYSQSFTVDIKSTIKVSATLSKSSYSPYDPGKCTLSGTVSLPKVASTWDSSLLAISNVEGTFELPINKYVSEYTNVVTISNLNMTTIVKTLNDANDGDDVTFTSSELNTIYTMDNNANKTPVTFYMNLYTYDTNNNQVGSVQRLTCDAGLLNAQPTLSFAEEETDDKIIEAFEGQPDVIIRYASDLLFTITATPQKGATISSVTVNNQPATLQSGNTYIAIVQNAQVDNYSVRVIDSRNLTSSDTFVSPLVNYILPTFDNWSIKRESQTSSDLVLNAVINAYNDYLYPDILNNVVVQYSIDNETWVTIPSTDYTYTSNKITITNLTLNNLIPHNQTGTFYLKVYDLLTETNDNKNVAVGIYTFARGDRKVRINGTLEIADENAQNRFEIRKPMIRSTSETFAGYWVDDKPVYRKVIDFGSLPNTTTKNVAHNISNLKDVVRLEGIASYTAGGNKGWMALPLQYTGNNYIHNVQVSASTTNITITSNSDRSSYSAYVIIEYTKTTD